MRQAVSRPGGPPGVVGHGLPSSQSVGEDRGLMSGMARMEEQDHREAEKTRGVHGRGYIYRGNCRSYLILDILLHQNLKLLKLREIWTTEDIRQFQEHKIPVQLLHCV